MQGKSATSEEMKRNDTLKLGGVYRKGNEINATVSYGTVVTIRATKTVKIIYCS